VPVLTVTDTSGETRTITGRVGETLMEAIRDAGFDDLLAMCGGACACATCHVYVEDKAVLQTLPPMSEGEAALLDDSDERRPNSRLSCQIPLVDALEGLHVTIAEAG
jgi:2Fe-2S ferredoxin